MQVRQRQTGQVAFERLPYRPGTGLGLLPEPDPGDIYFDMEGDPLTPRGGLEYLFGAVMRAGETWPFTCFWAHDRGQERRALEAFMAWVMQRLAVYPKLHIYHYAPYERTALCTLAMRHSTYEAQVDALLRQGVLVDLYQVVRQGILLSQDGYSIKDIEPLLGVARDGTVKNATASIVEYARYVDCVAQDPGRQEAQAILEAIRAYNEVDCVSTGRLHDWL
jgi:predicted RecB family nuclease